MNISLAPWDDINVEELVLLANNKNVSSTLRNIFPFPYTLDDAMKWKGFQKNLHPSQHFAIMFDSRLAGGIGCNLKQDVNCKCIEIGYWIGEPYWNKGIATAAVMEMTGYIFRNFDIVRIEAPVFGINKASMKVLENAGYSLEAIHKKAVFKNEVLMDEYLYVKLK
jgi:RimJ/RimL family protein N-acetyltransferase